MPPWRWTAGIVGILCLIGAWTFATNDAPFSKLEGPATALFAATGVLLFCGAVWVSRRLLLLGVAAGMLTYAFRAWEISIIGNGTTFQARVLGVCTYSMLFVFMLGLGLAFVRWEALDGRHRSH